MTQIRSLVISIFFILLACTKENEEIITPPTHSGELGLTSFRVETDEVSKATLDGLSIRFEAGDEIAIWDGVALRKFVAENMSDGLLFTGYAVDTDAYWAIYPWSEDCKVNSESGEPVFVTSVPQIQKAREASFSKGANIGIGKGGSDHIIRIKSVCGFLKFSLPSADLPTLAPGSMSQIKLSSADGVKLTGDIQVSIDANGNPVVNSTGRKDGDDRVVVSFAESAAKAGGTYYYSVLPCDLSNGINLEFTRTADSAVGVKAGGTKGNVLPMNTVLNLQTIIPDWQPADGEEDDDHSADPNGNFDYTSLGLSSHPRILLSDDDFRRLNAYIADGSYPELTQMHNRVIAYADELLGNEIPTLNEIVSTYPTFNVQKNRHLELLARPVLGRLFACSYAYRTTRNAKYLEGCRSLLQQVCNDEDWYPESFLSTAEIALGVSIAYDWLYYDLTKSEREVIRQNLCTKAIEAKGSSTLTPVNNTGQVHNTGLMAAAIACYEKNKALCSSLMEESISIIPSTVTSIYGPKGSYFEGYGYWSYGTNFQCIYNELLTTAFGTDKGLYEIAGFKNSAEYRLFMADHIASFSYADGGRAKVLPSPAMWYYAVHYQRPDLLFNELRLGKDDTDSRMTPMIPCALAKYNRLNTDVAVSPLENVWVDDNAAIAPVVIVRKGWNGKESDVYLGLKGGSAKVNHGHMDAGSFVYHAYGKIWSADVPQKAYAEYSGAGLSGRGQEGSLWKALVYNSLGHSTMSFANYAEGFLESLFSADKVHPTDHIVDGKATIIDSWTSGDELGGQMNLTPLFKYQASSVKRKAVIMNDGSLKIEDEITATSSADAKLIWRMVTPAHVSVAENQIILSHGNEAMSLTTSCTSGSVNDLTLCNWGTFQNSRPTGGTWGWNDNVTWNETHTGYNVTGFTLTVPKNTTVVMTTTMKKTESFNSPVVGLENISAGDNFKW